MRIVRDGAARDKAPARHDPHAGGYAMTATAKRANPVVADMLGRARR
jgi:hypothetical protein